MKKLIVLVTILCSIIFSSCSVVTHEDEDLVCDNDFYSVPGTYSMYYDEATEIVTLIKGWGKSSTAVNVYYHGNVLYYCPHKESLYYYKDDKRVEISIEDISCEYKTNSEEGSKEK